MSSNEAYEQDVEAESAYHRQHQQQTLAGVITPETTLVYRFFNSSDGTHFFSGDAAEATQLVAKRADFVYEHANFRAYTPPSTGGVAVVNPTTVPVYRFFDTRFGTHFYTASESEKTQVQGSRSDLTFEGAGFYEHAAARSGDVAVYRFFDTKLGTHLYTADATERAGIIATRADLKDEGVAFYSPTK